MDGSRSKTLSVDGRRIDITHPDKVLFPRDGITKLDLATYYRRVAPRCLAHWRDRPLTMHRFPDGLGKEGFYQKNVSPHFPEWIARRALPKEGGTVTQVLVNDAATLVYLAGQAMISAHLGLSRVDEIRNPDRLIFDLDPSDDDFAKVQRAARYVRDHLASLGLDCVPMATGSRGLHVVVPLDRSADFDAVRDFAAGVVGALAAAHPDELTREQRKRRRGKRVFLDHLRNAYGQTAVAPYSVRALPGAPVATPLDWQEALARTMSPRRYTIRNLFRRLAQKADPFAALDRAGQPLPPRDASSQR